MAATALRAPPIERAALSSRPNLDTGFNPLSPIVFVGVLTAGFLYVIYSVSADIDATGTKISTFLPYAMLFIAVPIALASRS